MPSISDCGIAFEFVAIHVSAGIALVGVADQELAIPRGLAQELPLQAGREAGAAAAAQPRNLELLVHQFRGAVDQHLVERLVAADRDIFFDVVRVDQSAVAQDDLLLSAEERNLVPHRNVREAVAEMHLRGDVIPVFDLAQSKPLRNRLRRQGVENRIDVIGLDSMQDDQRLAGNRNIDQRLLGAKAEAAGADEVHVQAALRDGVNQRGVDALGAVAGSAGAHADSDARARRLQFGQPGAPHRVECAQIANPGHGRVSRLSSASNSRCRDRSFM